MSFSLNQSRRRDHRLRSWLSDSRGDWTWLPVLLFVWCRTMTSQPAARVSPSLISSQNKVWMLTSESVCTLLEDPVLFASRVKHTGVAWMVHSEKKKRMNKQLPASTDRSITHTCFFFPLWLSDCMCQVLYFLSPALQTAVVTLPPVSLKTFTSHPHVPCCTHCGYAQTTNIHPTAVDWRWQPWGSFYLGHKAKVRIRGSSHIIEQKRYDSSRSHLPSQGELVWMTHQQQRVNPAICLQPLSVLSNNILGTCSR